MTRPRALGSLVAALESRDLLRQVVPGVDRQGSHVGPAHVVIGRVDADSREMGPGDCFVALSGERFDGHDFVPQAIAAGASAVVVERLLPSLPVPQLVVSAARPALAVAAAWVSGDPSHELGVVGVTGTDGKTTTCYLVRAVLEASGRPTGLLGTVDVVVGGRNLGNPGRTTTPEAPELQRHLAAMLAAGDRWAVVEASSHGLAQGRLAEVAFDLAILTNVTSEHLEFHRTVEAYRAAKRRLFEQLAVGPADPEKGFGKHALVNLDDPQAEAFLAAAREAGAACLTYGTAEAADVRLLAIEEGVRGLGLGYHTPRGEGRIQLQLAGRHNAHNALAAVAVGEALGLEPESVAAGLGGLVRVPGRMERVEAGQPFVAVVDYAHTAEALAQVLDELAPLAAAGGGGLIAVFGSGGERDRVKRPSMGRVAAERCRLTVLTDEDPRGEPSGAILEAIAEGARAAGAREGQDLWLIPDRWAAVVAAVEAARPGDVVLFAGKGHEKTIEGPDGARPWDEAAAVREALTASGWGDPA
ncbi:MAG TPA: UDP-N-acetylmuramoyl-L-alanyl-D-glutamate--2,6-diaminopimelate ligase [Candidatus Limnocylindrales bacterium]|nr:UDP-N-acetylmuramoyl-L-alanyl-D-glutamate--2,6-diaminopimelate ligase [Candidatus Limnocylindrales bacterium]